MVDQKLPCPDQPGCSNVNEMRRIVHPCNHATKSSSANVMNAIKTFRWQSINRLFCPLPVPTQMIDSTTSRRLWDSPKRVNRLFAEIPIREINNDPAAFDGFSRSSWFLPFATRRLSVCCILASRELVRSATFDQTPRFFPNETAIAC